MESWIVPCGLDWRVVWMKEVSEGDVRARPIYRQ